MSEDIATEPHGGCVGCPGRGTHNDPCGRRLVDCLHRRAGLIGTVFDELPAAEFPATHTRDGWLPLVLLSGALAGVALIDAAAAWGM